MSGGVAYVLDPDGTFERRCNLEMVDLERLEESDDIDFVQVAMMKHVRLTGSRHAERLLQDWAALQQRFVKVMPREYKKALAADAKLKATSHAAGDPVMVPVRAKENTDSDVRSVRL
jgi:glutamate synthase (NADPH) large chain